MGVVYVPGALQEMLEPMLTCYGLASTRAHHVCTECMCKVSNNRGLLLPGVT